MYFDICDFAQKGGVFIRASITESEIKAIFIKYTFFISVLHKTLDYFCLIYE